MAVPMSRPVVHERAVSIYTCGLSLKNHRVDTRPVRRAVPFIAVCRENKEEVRHIGQCSP